MSNARLMTRFLLGAAAEGLGAGAAPGGSLVRSTFAICTKVRDARHQPIKVLSRDHFVYGWRGREGGVVSHTHTSAVSLSEVEVQCSRWGNEGGDNNVLDHKP
jgi:hypothetical protein